MSIQTLNELFFVAMGHQKPDCLLTKRNGRYEPISSRDFRRRVEQLAFAIRATLGLGRGEPVALMAETCHLWPLVDFAALASGTILVPIYPTLLPDDPDQTLYIANDCGAKAIFVQGRDRLEALLARRNDLPRVRHLVLIDEGEAPGEGYTTLDALLAAGAPADSAQFEAEARLAKADDLATFIYTSGTTSNPKGVMLTHGNITSNAVDSLFSMEIQPHHTALSFLPLSHSFERTVDYIYFYRGVTIAYAESVATVAKNLMEVRPHTFVSVPRVYEKLQAKIFEGVAQAPPLRQKIFHWALETGRQALPYRLQQTRPPGVLGWKLALADRLVFGKLRERLGGRFEFAISGGAPLGQELAEFFWGAGLPIYEGYGLTETSPVLTVNSPTKVRMGCVGTAIKGVELRIAEDGEILARGSNIMRGYHNNPAATAEVIDDEGWFHTGDIGDIDADGFLRITDRKKELIVNAYGKNVPPAKVEEALKSSRFIGQAVALGDQRKFIAALLVPNFENLRAHLQAAGASPGPDPEMVAMPEVAELMQGEVDQANDRLAHYEEVKAWSLLPAELSIEGGELTPTQKVKRRIVTSKYAEQIDRMYREADARRG